MIDPDYEIIQRILREDKEAYFSLIDKYKDRSLSLAKSMLKSNEDAEEVLQDSFMRAFRYLKKFEWKSSFSTWFYRILVNQCKTKIKARNKHFNISLDAEEGSEILNIPIDDTPADINYENFEVKKIVHEEIENLAPIYGSIINLFYLQELSMAEIMDITGLPIGTIKTRLNRARLFLSDSLKQRLGDVYQISQNKYLQKEELVA